MRWKKAFALLLMLIIILTSCGGKTEFIGYDVPYTTNNIDPQFSTDSLARLIIMNIFQGLVVVDTQGEIHQGVAENWEVSSDKLTYTFYLAENSYWDNLEYDTPGKPVTSEDFVYSFQRMFAQQAPSPYCDDYLAIKNSALLLEGKCDKADLGVMAKGDYTIVFYLEHPDPMFLKKLGDPPAMPCNKSFFRSTKGRYGLERSLILGNGPFALTRWEKGSRMTLTPRPDYLGKGSTDLTSVELYLNRDDKTKRFTDGKTDILKTTLANGTNLKEDYHLEEYINASWGIVFSRADKLSANPFIRKATVLSLNRQRLQKANPTLETTESVFLSQQLREDTPTIKSDYPQAGNNLLIGLKHLGIDEPTKIKLAVAEGFDENYLKEITQSWEKVLGLKVETQIMTESQVRYQLNSGECFAGIVPFYVERDNPNQVVLQFDTEGIYSLNNPVYDDLCKEIYTQHTTEGMISKAKQAQAMLIYNNDVFPLYLEKGYYVLSETAQKIEIYPYDEGIRFYKIESQGDDPIANGDTQ